MLTKDLLLHILMVCIAVLNQYSQRGYFWSFSARDWGATTGKRFLWVTTQYYNYYQMMNNFFSSLFFIYLFFSNAVLRLKCFVFTHFLLLYWILLSSSFAFQILSIWFSHETFCACPFSLDLNAYTHAYHHQKSGWVVFNLAGDRSLS